MCIYCGREDFVPAITIAEQIEKLLPYVKSGDGFSEAVKMHKLLQKVSPMIREKLSKEFVRCNRFFRKVVEIKGN